MRWTLRLLIAGLVVSGGFLIAMPARAQSEGCGFPFDNAACGALPESARTGTGPRTPRAPRAPNTSPQSADRDCADFRTQADAQAFFQSQGPGDAHGLDADNDGIACENLPATLASVPSGSASLPKTGTALDAFAIGGASFLLGGLLLMLSVRRTRQDDPEPLIGW